MGSSGTGAWWNGGTVERLNGVAVERLNSGTVHIRPCHGDFLIGEGRGHHNGGQCQLVPHLRAAADQCHPATCRQGPSHVWRCFIGQELVPSHVWRCLIGQEAGPSHVSTPLSHQQTQLTSRRVHITQHAHHSIMKFSSLTRRSRWS